MTITCMLSIIHLGCLLLVVGFETVMYWTFPVFDVCFVAVSASHVFAFHFRYYSRLFCVRHGWFAFVVASFTCSLVAVLVF